MKANNNERLTTKVTNINGRFHCRLFDYNKLFDEMACKDKRDISFCMYTMLRWYDKLGGRSRMASRSRDRAMRKPPINHSKIWYKKDLKII